MAVYDPNDPFSRHPYKPDAGLDAFQRERARTGQSLERDLDKLKKGMTWGRKLDAVTPGAIKAILALIIAMALGYGALASSGSIELAAFAGLIGTGIGFKLPLLLGNILQVGLVLLVMAAVVGALISFL